ncbi:hypothetical protein NED98_02170 [Sphingomonas sp. MMSM20]|uniref:TadE/TadG family type IV pilus assembly protein n=1 Tax=Sphingomonas lycopersici TaxID=2951807 RepID=UPI00223840C6|nr:TadE/TadG family type IV pilus assembly protein [Sphingomonas lycopersici]MCW6529041.1 hypothetical protein [Sphingomonas lycopersici]
MTDPHLNTRSRRLSRCTRGTSVVELGIVLPLFALLVLGLVCVAITVGQKLRLQQAVARSLEMATAGGIDNADPTGIQQEAATAAGVPVSQVTVDEWLECDGVRQTSATTCDASQQVGRYVSVQISATYALPFSLPFGQGSIPLSTFSSVRLQ